MSCACRTSEGAAGEVPHRCHPRRRLRRRLARPEELELCSLFCTSCADVCGATARLAFGRSGQNTEMHRATLATFIRACELSTADCERHAPDQDLKSGVSGERVTEREETG